MWDCKTCGTTGIPDSLEECPHCAMIAGMQESGWVESLPEPVGTAAPTEGAAEGDNAPDAPPSPQPTPTTKKGW